MLYPAQLYRGQLNKAMVSCWYKEKYKYYFSGEYREFQIPDNTEYRRDFVHLDKDGEVDGYFSYHYNDGSKALTNFGLIGFSDNNAALLHDAIREIESMFNHGAQRCEFWAFADNPAIKIYDRLMSKYGGKRVGYLHRSAYFDGAYHDTVMYEILVEDFVGDGHEFCTEGIC